MNARKPFWPRWPDRIAEAFFRTGKYHSSLPPGGFADLGEARQWAQRLVLWCNHQHRHSSLWFVTPAQKHAGEDIFILAKRKDLYEAKRSEKPERWIRNTTRNWEPVRSETLNPINPRELEKTLKKTA